MYYPAIELNVKFLTQYVEKFLNSFGSYPNLTTTKSLFKNMNVNPIKAIVKFTTKV